MNGRRFALFAAFALFVMFVAANVTANSWFRSWRLDLTENRIFSLSRGTQQTLDELSEPLELKFYYARDAAAIDPRLQAYAARVRELLQTFQARSGGRVRLVEVNVRAFSDEEDEALEAGIEPVRLYQGADPIYFGLVGANAIDDERVIPLFDPGREAFLEYEITRLIYELENPDRTRVALITALPLDPADAQGAFSVFAADFGRFLDVTRLDANFTDISDTFDVLAVIHPGALSDEQLFAIDQFILRKGRAFIALDPAALAAQGAAEFDPFNPTAPAPASSSLAPLLARWGVTLAPTVVLDGENALPVSIPDPQTGQPVDAPQPLFFVVPAAELDREDLATAWLQRGINFGLAGGFTWTVRDGVEFTPLARTSGRTMRLPAEAALMRPSPFDIAAVWQPTGGRVETIALRVAGNLETAFPNGRPAPAPIAAVEGETAASAPTDLAQTAPRPAPVTRSATPAQIVLVADVDFLSNDFYVDPQQQVTVADNGAFALNAIDVLAGSDALVSLRSRSQPVRRMTLLDDMEEEAQERIRTRREQLEAELADTERRLQELQARGRGSGYFTGDLGAELTPEENAEIARFRASRAEIRGQQRRVERDLRREVNGLETLLVFINVWLAPLLVAGAGLFLFWRRQRRGRSRG